MIQAALLGGLGFGFLSAHRSDLSPYIFDLLQTSVVARRLARCFAGWRLRHSLCLLRAVKLESQL
ncbi:hypothetical protein KDW67_34345, partial [Burkholderia cenocepacia]|uniref:hypothetical protein n=1 Tax=Burkholderia cenocepacia TaxID=95486 RepID=UPI001B9BE05F